MKKRPPPQLSKAELEQKVEELLSAGFNHPAEAVKYLLRHFTGWDLEAIILDLRRIETTNQLKKETQRGN